VSRPECFIEVRAIRLLALQIHQAFFQADEKLARFLEKHLAKTVFRTARQVPYSLIRSPVVGRVHSARQYAPDPTPEHLWVYRLNQPACNSLAMFWLKLARMVARKDEYRQKTVRRQVANGCHQRKPVTIRHFQVGQ
jgi:hypothetical protein